MQLTSIEIMRELETVERARANIIERSTAYQAGFSAAEAAYEKWRNPFPHGSAERAAWDAGWEAC